MIEIAPGISVVEPALAEPRPEWVVRCPKCKAPANTPCTYMTLVQRWHKRWTGDCYRYEQLVKHRVGDEMPHSHVQRRMAYANKPVPLKPVRSLSPAMTAYWDYDRREYHQLRDWLRANHSLFERPS